MEDPLSLSAAVLLSVAMALCYADRSNISVAILPMAKELQLSRTVIGWILGIFFYGYMASQFVGSLLAVRFGGRRVLMLSVLFFSVFTMLTPMAANLGLFAVLLCRLCLGVAEGLSFPAAYSILGTSPPNLRSLFAGLLHVGLYVGIIVAFYGSDALIKASGWRAVFHVFGVAGLLWCGIWRQFYLLAEKPAASSAARSSLSEDLTLAWRLLLHPRCRPIFVAHFAHATCAFICFSWLPTVLADLARQVGQDPESPAAIQARRFPMVLPYIFMGAFSFGGSVVADHLLRTGSPRTAVRRLMTGAGYGLAAMFMVMFMASTPSYATTVYLALSVGCSSIAIAGHEAIKLDVVPSSHAGVLQGVSNTFASLGGVIAVPLAAYISTWTESWVGVFGLMAGLYSCAGLYFVLAAKADPLALSALGLSSSSSSSARLLEG